MKKQLLKKPKIQKCFITLLFVIALFGKSNAAYYWQVSSITSFTGGATYAQNAAANPLVLNILQCTGGATLPNNSTSYHQSLYINSVNSTSGGTLIATNVIATPAIFSPSYSYIPSTATVGTFYYYYVLSLPSMTTCGFTGTLTSPISTVVVSGPAEALNFDGVNDYVQIPQVISSDFTMEYWLKTTMTGASGPQWYNGSGLVDAEVGGQTTDFGTVLNGSKLSFGIGAPDITITSTSNVNTGNWVHVAVSWKKATGEMKLYINGVLEANTLGSTSLRTAPTNIKIGALNYLSNFSSASFDELRIWNVIRTQCEINTYKNCEIPTTASGLLANYHFNQGLVGASNATVTTLTDAAGTNTGTLTNFALTGNTSNWVTPGGVTSGSVTPANLAITVGATVTNSVICLGNSTMLSGTGANTYSWTNSVINATSFSPTVTATYTVTGTNTLTGCTNTAVSTVTVNALPTVTVNVSNVLCNGGSTGSATVTPSGGTAPYTYVWSNAANTAAISNATPGVYTSTVTDAKGCKAVKSATVTQPTALLTSTAVANALCNAGNGSSTVTATGGTSPYTYVWSTGATTSSVSNVAGAYTATVTDANACTSIKSLTITQPSAITTTITAANALCNGGSTGSATLTAAGGTTGYTYMWSTGATASSVTNVIAGVYTSTLTDANGCTAVKSVTITQPSAIITTSAVVNALCNGGSTGSATVTAAGGTSPYTYMASNGATVSAQSNLLAGTYVYTVTDGNGCNETQALTITEPTALNVTSVANNTVVCAGSSSTLTANGTGGTGTISYTWVAGATSNVNTVSPTTTSVYTVDATDANNCVGTSTVEVTVNALPIVSVNSGSVCAGQSFTMIPTGTDAYTYSNGSDVAMPTADESYTVTGTNTVTGCSNMAVSSVTVNALPTVSVISASICAGATGTLTASGADTYTWSTGSNIASITDNPTSTTIYTVSGTSLEGCLGGLVTATITVGAAPTIVVNSESICAGASATLTANGVTTYTWSTGENTSSIIVTPTTNTVYTVNGDLTGCGVGANNSSSVTVNALPTVIAVTNNTLLCTGETATLSVSGATSYTWSTTENTMDIAVSPTVQTTYTVDGTDANGCVNSTTIMQDVSACTGVNQIAAINNELIVYPNPSNGTFNVNVSTLTKVTVLDVLGKVVYTESFEAGKNQIDLHQQADGVYFLKAESNGLIKTLRLIKK